LIYLPVEELSDLIKSYVDEDRALREQIADLCLFMEGGIEYNTAWGMSFLDREIAIKRINKRMRERQGSNGPEYM
jgi:hypothetical protein